MGVVVDKKVMKKWWKSWWALYQGSPKHPRSPDNDHFYFLPFWPVRRCFCGSGTTPLRTSGLHWAGSATKRWGGSGATRWWHKSGWDRLDLFKSLALLAVPRTTSHHGANDQHKLLHYAYWSLELGLWATRAFLTAGLSVASKGNRISLQG